MKGEHMLMYALVFVLGFMVARMMEVRLVEGRKKPEPLKTGDPCLYSQQCFTKFCDWTTPAKCIPHGRCG